MRFSDYLLQAFRNLGRQKLRSALTILAIIIGATSVTIMLALVTSIKSFFVQQFNSTGQIRQIAVTQATDLDYQQARNGGGSTQSGVKLSDDLLGKIKALPHVTNVSPQTSVYVFDSVNYQDKKLSVQNFQAYEPNDVIKNDMVVGRDLNEQDGTGVVTLTSEYADKLGFKGKYSQIIGQKLDLKTVQYYSGLGAILPPNPTTTRSAQPPIGQQSDISATVVGVVNSQNAQAAMYFPLAWARGLLETQTWQVESNHASVAITNTLADKGYQAITVEVDAPENSDSVASSIRNKFGVGASTAQDFIKKQLAIFNIIGYVLGGIGGISLAVAAVGVVNTMVMATMERTREIGVMRAVGAKRATISRLFTLEASLLGFLGGMLGIGLGYCLVLVANPLVNKQLAANSVKATNIIILPPWLMLSVVIITTLIGMFAGLYPARRAARLNPVDALHHE